MPKTTQIEISKLILDLKNFRTVPQKREIDAIKAMIAIKPDRFFAVIESIIDDGYLPTENIIVLTEGTSYIVKEGNRRIAALKLIQGIYKLSEFGLPTSLVDRIDNIDAKWKVDNNKVPCTIFAKREAELVDKIVTLTHGKGEKASRDKWSSVARGRHNRDVRGVPEHGLDLLEKYLKKGSNINRQQRERWAGDYHLTVLDEALGKIYPRLGFEGAQQFVKKYPQIKHLTELENILLDIGLEQIRFETVRSPDFPSNYGIPEVGGSVSAPSPPTSKPEASELHIIEGQVLGSTVSGNPNGGDSIPNSVPTVALSNPIRKGLSNKSVAINDPKHIADLLRKFSPKGRNRQKVVALRDELRKLRIANNPIAFCFLLRSMFEISAKAYVLDHGLNSTKQGGKDKTLVEILRSITGHLTDNNSNTAMVKVLHGAMTELGKPEGLLSVTSMNNLVHNPIFSIAPPDICILFGNIYPLLEAMN